MSTISDPAVAPAASPTTSTADPPTTLHSTHAQPSGRSLRAVAGAFLIGVLAPVMLILIIPRAREVTLWVLGEQSTPAAPYDVPDNVIVNQAQSEGAAAYQDNLYVARWFAACSKFSAIEKMPPELVIWVQPFRVEWTSTSDAKIETPPGPQQFQVAELSQALYRQRVAGAASVHDTMLSHSGCSGLSLYLVS